MLQGVKDQRQIALKEPELKNLKVLYGIYIFFVFGTIIMPQYFGLNIGYDLTCARMANLLFVVYMMLNPLILSHFVKTTLRCEIFYPFFLYLIVAGYTMVFRVDINAFFLVFFEALLLFMMVYGIRYVIGYQRAVKWINACAYFFGIYGLVEFACGQSLFLKFLRTLPTAVNNCYRSGHYRVMGPCGHPLGYGLVLLLLIALACVDLEKNEVYLFKRPVLLVLLLLNVVLTGSRSTLGIALAEVVVIILISNRTNIKKSLFMLVCFIFALGLFLLLFYKTGIGRYILMQITSVIDQVLGTELAGNFGADVTTLQNSESYRENLPEIFKLDWLNPFIGRGVKRGFGAEINGVYIHSVDNYYVVQYIKYAYPGLISYVLFMVTTLVVMVKSIVRYKSALCKLLLVATVCYYVNLWWLDALQTLKYEYIMIALFFAFVLQKRDESKTMDAVL
ncbi:MAG: hypothetical protein IJZ55_04755 [Lachnospiraceae bacterium]|nr:hypothetical protein [Lachnospiraceae bacterium]